MKVTFLFSAIISLIAAQGPEKVDLDARKIDWPAEGSRASHAEREFSLQNSVIRNAEIWKDRVFYCIPRLSNGVLATLVTAKRSSNDSGPPLLHPFPNWSFQSPGDDCRGFQSVTSVAADTMGRLWVLDAGGIDCPPKIVIFDLSEENSNGKEIARHVVKIPRISAKNLRHIVVDWGAMRGPRAYASDAGDGTILVYSLKEDACWRVHTGVMKGVGDMSISYFYLALFFVTREESDELLQVDLMALREAPRTLLTEVSATKVGKLTGNTTTVAADKRGGIVYFVPKTNSIMRWDTVGTQEADWHNLLYTLSRGVRSSNALPKVPRIIFDANDSGWALANGLRSNASSTLIKIYNSLN